MTYFTEGDGQVVKDAAGTSQPSSLQAPSGRRHAGEQLRLQTGLRCCSARAPWRRVRLRRERRALTPVEGNREPKVTPLRAFGAGQHSLGRGDMHFARPALPRLIRCHPPVNTAAAFFSRLLARYSARHGGRTAGAAAASGCGASRKVPHHRGMARVMLDGSNRDLDGCQAGFVPAWACLGS